MPCPEKRARQLLARGRARVRRLAPFVIRLTDRSAQTCALHLLHIKPDPGSKTTGLAVACDVVLVDAGTGEISTGAAALRLMDLMHRGRQISAALIARCSMRRRRPGAS
jgi:hypothetical protein